MIRVLVANRPRLMRDLVIATVTDQPDIVVVGEVSDDTRIAAIVEETVPDFVVIALDDPSTRPTICDTVMQQHPEIRIIAVAPHHNRIVYYWASPDIHSSDIESSEQGLLNALRSRSDPVGPVVHSRIN